MKKIIAIAVVLGLALCLCACAHGGSGNGLLSAASPDTSALMLYICDNGQGVRQLTMYDSAVEREILDKLAGAAAKPAPDWTPRDVTMPVYGLEIGRNDDEPGFLQAAWSNGYLIMADGSAYEFDFDLAALETAYDWRDRETGLSVGSLPCSRALAQDGESWISSMLTPAQELSAPVGISMTLDYLDCADPENRLIAVTFTNAGDVEWCYGTYYHLEAELDGAWYAVPPERERAFPDIAMILPAGESRQEIYHTAAYGELPSGCYRIAVKGLTAEFVIQASCIPEGDA